MENIKTMTEIFKALSDPNKLRIVLMLLERKMCVCEINEILDISLSTISAHLKTLKYARIIEDSKDGRWVEYKLVDDEELVRFIRNIYEKLKDDPLVIKDRLILSNITRESCVSK